MFDIDFRKKTLLLLLLLTTSCALASRDSQAPRQEKSVLSTSEPSMAEAGSSSNSVATVQPKPSSTIPVSNPTTPVNLARKIIMNGEFSLVMKNFEPFYTALQGEVQKAGGYISQVEARRGSGAVYSASIKLRIPPEQVDSFASWVRQQGILENEKISADDISEQYYDLKARLENAKKFEARLLEMVRTETGKLQDLLQVEEKLNQIREQIEQMEGRLRYLDSLTSMSSITINVRIEERYVAPHKPTFGERASEVWSDSIDALKSFVEGLGLLIVALIPWLIPLAIFLAVTFLLLRVAIRFLKKPRKS